MEFQGDHAEHPVGRPLGIRPRITKGSTWSSHGPEAKRLHGREGPAGGRQSGRAGQDRPGAYRASVGNSRPSAPGRGRPQATATDSAATAIRQMQQRGLGRRTWPNSSTRRLKEAPPVSGGAAPPQPSSLDPAGLRPGKSAQAVRAVGGLQPGQPALKPRAGVEHDQLAAVSAGGYWPRLAGNGVTRPETAGESAPLITSTLPGEIPARVGIETSGWTLDMAGWTRTQNGR